jgi:hypothetical protein
VTLLAQTNSVSYLLGMPELVVHPLVPFNELVCGFLDELSSELRASPDISKYPDVMSFAFWCRKANINKLKEEYIDSRPRLGLGLTFHVAPSNVPINFAFSFAFGLLSGNANVVRVPSKLFPQVDIVCSALKKLFSKDKFHSLASMNSFIRYAVNDEVTERFSAHANARLVWGGDETVKNIQKFPILPRGVDLTFGDRFSIAVLGSEAIADLPDDQFNQLVDRFYNDTYLMDQNACSSPSFVIWMGSKKEAAQERFWNALLQTVSKKYSLEPVHAVDKLTHLCDDAIAMDGVKFTQQSTLLYRAELQELKTGMEDLRGKFGYFFEYGTNDLASIKPLLVPKCQTITYFGIENEKLKNLVLTNYLGGVDRIVPVGSALEIGLIWDGYDLIRSLSRVIDVK